MPFDISCADINLSLVVRHQDPFHKGIAAGSYAGEMHVGDHRTSIWGYGGVKNPETLFFYGISHCISEAFKELSKDTFSMQVFVSADGFKRTLFKLAPIWISNGGLNSLGKIPDAYDEIKRCHLLASHGRLNIDKVPRSTGGFPHFLEQANRVSRIAYERGAFNQIGLMKSGLDLNEVEA